jgi:hypothetical protein
LSTCGPNCRKTHHSWNEKFCSSCGSPVTRHTQTVPKLRELNNGDLSPEFEDELIRTSHGLENNWSIWLPNTIRIGHTFTQYEDPATYEITPELMKEEIERLESHYDGWIRAVHAKFGVLPTTHYGAVSDAT